MNRKELIKFLAEHLNGYIIFMVNNRWNVGARSYFDKKHCNYMVSFDFNPSSFFGKMSMLTDRVFDYYLDNYSLDELDDFDYNGDGSERFEVVYIELNEDVIKIGFNIK